MAKRVSFNALDPDDIMNFPLDVEFDLPEICDSFYDDIARQTDATVDTDESDETFNDSSSSSLSSGSFYDIDNMSLSLIPFDTEEV